MLRQTGIVYAYGDAMMPMHAWSGHRTLTRTVLEGIFRRAVSCTGQVTLGEKCWPTSAKFARSLLMASWLHPYAIGAYSDSLKLSSCSMRSALSESGCGSLHPFRDLILVGRGEIGGCPGTTSRCDLSRE
jgi:hypothetical protein